MIAFLSSAFRLIWRKITPTNALRHASGDTEIMFMESVYRLTYFLALSYVDGDSIPYLIYRTIVQLLIAAFAVAETLFVFVEFKNLEMDTFIASISVVAMHALGLFRIKNIMGHGEIYRKLAESMESVDRSTENRRRLVDHWAAIQNSFLTGLLILGNLSLVAWHIFPLIDDEEYNLMVVIYLPFRYTTPIRYVITYIVVSISFMYFCHWVMISDLMLQAYMLTLICQLTVLCDCFQNIVKDCSDGLEDNYTLCKNKVFRERYQKRMGFLIEEHNKILNTLMDIRAILSFPLLCQLGASGTLICIVGYQAVSSDIMANVFKFMMSMLYLGYNLFQLYIICRWCEEITNQSVNVGEAVYSSGWEMGVFSIPGARTSIMMVIARANKPLVFSAGGMYNMSLMAFTNLVKTSYSALTMLLRFHQD